MMRPRFDPGVCLDHLAAHRKMFEIANCAPLAHFVALISEVESAMIECSVKVEGEHTHAARFNLWFQDPPSERHLARALRLISRVEGSERIKLDDSRLHRFYDDDFDWTKIQGFVVGVDLRERWEDSRLKVWFKLGAYRAKEEEALVLSGAPDTLGPLLVGHGLLIGFDFDFGGKTAIKVYPRIAQTDLLDAEVRGRLARNLSEAALARMQECQWSHVSLARNPSGKILHFRPTTPAAFVADLLADERANEIVRRYQHEHLLDTVVSVREEDLVKDRVADFNLYFMLGTCVQDRSGLL
jgi:LynF/TruF/PatF family peptide O-prenyltransferase